MGLDLEKSLKSSGYSVERFTKVGWNDQKLLDWVENLGDSARFDKVFLYCGGNSQSPSVGTILNLVESLGGKDKVIAILPPQNTNSSEKALANRDGLLNSGVSVFLWEFPSSDFWPDGIHLKPRSNSSLFAAQEILKKPESRFMSNLLLFSSVLIGTIAVLRFTRGSK